VTACVGSSSVVLWLQLQKISCLCALVFMMQQRQIGCLCTVRLRPQQQLAPLLDSMHSLSVAK
jgi:hypothetical protein